MTQREAAHQSPGRAMEQRHRALVTCWASFCAALCERAPGRYICQIRHVPGNRFDAAALERNVWDTGQEPARVRVLRRLDDLFYRASFYDPPRIHDGNRLARLGGEMK